MLGILTEEQIEELLTRQVTGRIGCHADGETYIVPINYVYRNGSVYAHSGPGKKIDMLHKNPKVCFQIDDIRELSSWKSVIAWGTFEVIQERKEIQQAMQALISHIMPAMGKMDGNPSHGITDDESSIGSTVNLILYKIHLDKKTGRFEDMS